MCVPLAPVINPAGFALSKLPVPGFISDPGQALAQKVAGKNQLTDPTYKTKSTPPQSAPVTPPATALASTPMDDASNPFVQGTNQLKTALGS